MMSLKQMRYALAVEHHRHFGRAAQSCFVTQSALSQQVTLLEEHLGWEIFERTGKTVFPTPRGKLFLKDIKRIIGLTTELEEQFARSPSQMQMTISMALIPTIAPYLLPTLLPALVTKMDPIKFFASERTTDDLIGAVTSGECDFGILATDVNDERLIQAKLFADPFVLATPPDSNIVGPVDLSQVEREQMLLLSEGHCLRDQTVDACRLATDLGQKTFAATSLSTIVELVANGLGMTLLPAISLRRERRGDQLNIVSLQQPGAGRTISMVWRRSSPLSSLFQNIAKIVGSVGRAILVEENELPVKQHTVLAAKHAP